MKRLILLLLTLALALTQIAFAENDVTIQAVYDALVADGSEFNQTKEIYAQYYEGVELDAALEDNSIVITLNSANEWVDSGAWTFTQEENALTTTVADGDYYSMGYVMTMYRTVAAIHGVNGSLLNGYIAALGADNPYFSREEGENGVKWIIPLNPSYEMEGLDDMVIRDANDIGFLDALDEDFTNMGGSYGKVILVLNGNVHGLNMLVCEYGGLDDVAYQDIINVISIEQPDGWEKFVAEYTALQDAEADGYSVVLNADDDQVGEFLDERYEGYAYAIVRIGQGE